ncbi:hypothetical protein NMG60_11013228 [Bertholletia excelsa]
MKSICNLGVWCISIQQLDAMHLDANFHSLLRAIVHALENPMGSLSTTFEGIQAVMKLANQLHEKMRDTSSTWAPSIYRRLISTDKRLRDMCERCLLKISSVLFPPPLDLSKVLVADMRTTLLPGMKELLINGQKIQTIQAWGWFIRLLGPYAVKNRHLVNEMLKVPEQTFSDGDPQLLIASLVSWEGLIDALIQPPTRAPETNAVDQPHIQHAKTYERNDNQTEDEISKGVRLIMMPLVGILSSKCNVSVHSSCLNTWCYLLHKLDVSINCPSILKTAWEPIFDTVFRVGPNSKIILLWNVCLDLLDDFILTKHKGVDLDLDNLLSCQLSPKIPGTADPISDKCSWKHYAIKWLPWNLNHLDFCMKMIHIVLSHEVNSSACHAALRIFRSVLRGVRNVLRNLSINYDKVMSCLNVVLQSVKGIFEGVNSENCEIDDNSCATSLHFAVAVIEGLEPSILGSPLYKVELDLKYIDHLKSVDENKHAGLLRAQLTAYKDMVLPIVYLIILYFCGVFKSTSNGSGSEFILQETSRYFKFVLLSFEPSEILHPIIGLFYKHVGYEYLRIWAAVAGSLTEYIDEVKDISHLKLQSDIPSCLAVCQLFSYPFAVCSSPQRVMMTESTAVQKSSNISFHSQIKLELEHAFEAWKSLYACVYHASSLDSSTSNSFVDDILLKLNDYLFENTRELESCVSTKPSNDTWNHDFHFLFGNVVVCVLEHITTSGSGSGGSKDRDGNHHKRPGNSKHSLEIAARFMTLSWKMAETNPPTGLTLISRVFSTLVHFLGCLHLKEDILSFIQIISSPLLLWLSSAKLPCEDITHRLQLLWSETLYSLQRSHPPIEYNSYFLKLQAPLLEKTLDHPNPFISESTITFWNSTYADEINLDYPQSLLPILDKLTRNQRLNLSKRNHPSSAPQRYRVMATQRRSSKRVEFVEDKGKLFPCLKRRRQELTQHQKEVRRAQQGRERDCNGHGPGIRTYTTVDFSQGNGESQDSQEIRDAEAILEMLKRSG